MMIAVPGDRPKQTIQKDQKIEKLRDQKIKGFPYPMTP
jgi:hypothetical protein